MLMCMYIKVDLTHNNPFQNVQCSQIIRKYREHI